MYIYNRVRGIIHVGVKSRELAKSGKAGPWLVGPDSWLQVGSTTSI